MKSKDLVVLMAGAMAILLQGWGAYRVGFGGVRGSGRITKEERPIRSVNAVELATSGELQIDVGVREELIIEAEDNLIKYLDTDVRGGTLVIQTRPGVSINATRPFRFYLTVNELDEIALSSSGDAKAPNLEAKRFSVSLSSSGDLRMGDLDAERVEFRLSSSGDLSLGNLRADSLDVRISSSGDLRITGGSVEKQTIEISSSGDYEAQDLESVQADARLSSSGNARIRASDYLRARLSSSGDLHYAGSPEVDRTEGSSGNVQPIRD